jgi:hypothetical protein
MKIETNQTFKLSENPFVVGVVTGYQDVQRGRYYVKTTLGERVVWNSKTGTWSNGAKYLTPSEDTLLVLASDSDCCKGCDKDDEAIVPENWDIWTDSEGESHIIIKDGSNTWAVNLENADGCLVNGNKLETDAVLVDLVTNLGEYI